MTDLNSSIELIITDHSDLSYEYLAEKDNFSF